MRAQRIEDYALLGDLYTAALVGRDGSIDWLCLPRFDSPACFAALLDSGEHPASSGGQVSVAGRGAAGHGDDEPRAGFWRLAPAAGGSCTSRRYRGDSLVLEQEWHTLEGHWDEPDNGLWEVRGPRRHFVHSKVLAWAGVDRMVQAVERFGRHGPVDRWWALRARIHDEVCDRGFDPDRGTFTQCYGSSSLDASLLLLPRVGFLPFSDPRVVGTVEAVRRELSREGLLLRYSDAGSGGGDGELDGLPGSEGAFLACSFWLVDALEGIGRRAEGVELFERLLGLANDVGLLSEEYDVDLGRQLGNTPQAFSHVGLVNAARHLSGGSATSAAGA